LSSRKGILDGFEQLVGAVFDQDLDKVVGLEVILHRLEARGAAAPLSNDDLVDGETLWPRNLTRTPSR
jgi:hypothetical protein